MSRLTTVNSNYFEASNLNGTVVNLHINNQKFRSNKSIRHKDNKLPKKNYNLISILKLYLIFCHHLF